VTKWKCSENKVDETESALLHLVIERNQEQGLSFSLSKQMPEDNCGQAYTAKCSRACIATDVFSCPIVEGAQQTPFN
jgi:hypothetical protein